MAKTRGVDQWQHHAAASLAAALYQHGGWRRRRWRQGENAKPGENRQHLAIRQCSLSRTIYVAWWKRRAVSGGGLVGCSLLSLFGMKRAGTKMASAISAISASRYNGRSIAVMDRRSCCKQAAAVNGVL